MPDSQKPSQFSFLDAEQATGDRLGMEILRLIGVVQNSNQELNDRLARHMEIEEFNMKLTRDEIKLVDDKVSAVAALIQAFPKDEQGGPDINGHREFHIDRIDEHKDRRQLRNGVRQAVTNAAAIFILVLLALGVKEWLSHPGADLSGNAVVTKQK